MNQESFLPTLGEQSRYTNHPRAHAAKFGRMTSRKNFLMSYDAYQAT